ncbi:MAG: site-2 protease family protein [Elainellaceae cyanobacterium]
MTSRDIWVAVIVFAGWMVSLCLHEFGHAVVAYWGGDTSVKDKGYLTLNPLNYTHPLLSIGLPLIFLLIGGIPLPGGAVYIDEKRLRNRLWRSLVSAAGPFASLLTAIVLALPFRFRWGAAANPVVDLGETMWNLLNPSTLAGQVNPSNFMDGVLFPALALLIALDVYVTLFNLLPIPPLDGYGIIEPWLPSSLQRKVRNSGIPWIFVLFGVLWFVPPLMWGLFLVTGGGDFVVGSAALLDHDGVYGV